MLKLNKRQHKGVEELWLAMFTRMRTVLGATGAFPSVPF